MKTRFSTGKRFGTRNKILYHTTPVSRESSMNLSPDGMLQISSTQLGRLPLQHLVTGLDDDECVPPRQCGSSIALSGYTEWTCSHEPLLSLGWDWELEGRANCRVRRLGLPRTNVQVVDEQRRALPWNESLQVLACFIDSFDWNTPTFEAVCEKYAA